MECVQSDDRTNVLVMRGRCFAIVVSTRFE